VTGTTGRRIVAPIAPVSALLRMASWALKRTGFRSWIVKTGGSPATAVQVMFTGSEVVTSDGVATVSAPARGARRAKIAQILKNIADTFAKR